jgi:hypothetical protein
MKFDKTRVKNMVSAGLLSGEQIKVKFIEPLSSSDGLVYVTSERIYFQPAHPSLFDKPVMNIKHSNIQTLFQRRYTL